MCLYCFCADYSKDYWPYKSDWTWEPSVSPLFPFDSELIRKHQEALARLNKLLTDIKAMEDALGGCPCEEPEKMDWIRGMEKHLEKMKKELDAHKDK